MPKQRKNRARAGNNAPNAADADAAAQLKPKRKRKSVPLECPSQRTSVYRGVTRHRWTGRFEAHLWDKNTWSETQRKKKGRQVYLGAYGDEEAAARAYDLAALKYWGRDTVLNFPLSSYDEELREMEGQSREEYIGSLRRKSTGFSRGVSKYRGVARHHHNGKWEARIGRVFGNKYLYLGTYATQEEAAVAYDVAAIQHRGLNAVTNFDVSRYIKLHHRCRAGDADGLDATNEIPGQLLRDLGQDPTIDLDKDMADAAFHDERQRPDRTADHLLPQGRPLAHAASTTSALGLLPQSSRFKEMIEREAASESGTGSPSSSWCSPSPPTPPTQQQQQPEYSGGASSARCSFFPDDVQTYFGCQDDDGVDYAEVDALLSGDLGAYAGRNPPMFPFELDV